MREIGVCFTVLASILLVVASCDSWLRGDMVRFALLAAGAWVALCVSFADGEVRDG